tara:strand:- start:14025 stop:14843 length:819 start_codon:yes stop_codon:yes gene_type:complete
MTVVVNGKEIANRIEKDLRDTVGARPIRPRLDIFIVGSDPVTASFIAAKRRVASEINVEFSEHVLPVKTTTKEIVECIRDVAPDSGGVVVQLPLPTHISQDIVLGAIPPEKDVDVLNKKTLRAFANGDTHFVPPVAGSVDQIFRSYDISVYGKAVAIVGKGQLVGLPLDILLRKMGAQTKVLDRSTTPHTFIHTLKSSDIVISGAGVPSLITPSMLKPGVVLIDAGTSSAGGSIKGDVSDDCIKVASLISKTPGGVGPLTVAILFKNLIHGQ